MTNAQATAHANRLCRMIFVTLILFALTNSAFTQQLPKEQQTAASTQNSSDRKLEPDGKASAYTLRVNSRLVVLDVVVTDKLGNIVNNLKADDFRIYEDKVFQPIRSFEVSPSSQPASTAQPLTINSTAELDRQEPNAPVSIIVLDEINTKFTDEAFTRYSLKKYLATQGNTLVQPTMLIAVNLDHLIVLRDYTTSKQEILSALDHHLQENPWKAMGGSFQAEQFDAAFASLLEVAQATGGHPGHKNMIWIGKGMPTIDPIQLTPDAAASLDGMIALTTNMFRDSRITLYTVDPSGVPAEEPSEDADGFYDEDPFGGQVNFNAMASATGGKAFYGRNDIDAGVGSSVEAGAHFYTLSYAPSSDSSDTKAFRNIQVRMVNPNLTATTREGYYAETPPVPAATDETGKSSDRFIFDLKVAADSLMIYDAVPFIVKRDTTPPDSFEINIDPRDVDWEEMNSGQPIAHVTLLAESFDKKNNVLSHEVKIVTAQAPAPSGEDSSTSTGLTLHINISTPPSAARLRFVVRMNHSGKLGTNNLFLTHQKNAAP